MKVFKILLMLVVLGVTLGSCTMKKAVNKETIIPGDDKSVWNIVELSNKAISSKINGITPQLILDGNSNRYSVITGCNTLNGSFTIKNSSVQFGKGMSTMMFSKIFLIKLITWKLMVPNFYLNRILMY